MSGAEVWAAAFRGREEEEGRRKRIIAQPFGRHVCSLWPSLPARMVHEVFRTEELSERRRAQSVDNAGFEVEEIRARYVYAARGPVVKHVDEVELRAVVAAVLAVAPKPLSSHSTF